MRWKGRKQSSHVEDRRGQPPQRGSGGNAALGALLFGLFRKGNRKTKILLILGGVVACFMFNINPVNLLMSPTGQPASLSSSPADPEMKAYLATMKSDNEIVWSKILAAHGKSYRPANMVIYTGRTQTAGGTADARMGPFYMPADETIYIDPSFFQEMRDKFGATGDFAQAYVVAHEVGHHIQHLLNLTDKVHSQRGKISESEYNKLSVRLELQADFLAGVFAHHADEQFQFLEHGDIDEAIRCAEAIGDDRLQKMTRGEIQPDLFTHGTSAQRKRWFMKGYKSGQLSEGDTFTIPYDQL
ncbi:neutral zinc metallopeptidase [Verrucomicrobiaceae bacterium N1E253]|uniref:Neutral zinc metallopeptidase n=1 Tax=Oceaniferula marina TaxID=2748318 RepID=A0A851GHB0_9BACT|nr:neutral zinc metallopeptidase [Oceaniferula marina]NWK56746.1 neutral zinc metallopeptidase [Oceaniferula marina]